MAKSGAETFRVEDTMIRILRTSKLQVTEVYVTPTGIIATLSDPEIDPITEVLRINNRVNNLSGIHEVNQISRDLCDDIITVEEAYDKMLQINNQKRYPKELLTAATIIATGGYTGIFGGSLFDCIVAAINGFLIIMIGRLLLKRIGSSFMIDAVKSFTIALFTMICTMLFHELDSAIIIIGSIMPLVPGLPITNAIRDTLQGNFMAGTARAVEAFVISISITIGIGFGMGFYNMLERVLGL